MLMEEMSILTILLGFEGQKNAATVKKHVAASRLSERDVWRDAARLSDIGNDMATTGASAVRFAEEKFVEARHVNWFGHKGFDNFLRNLDIKRRSENDARRMAEIVGALREFDAGHARHFDIGNEKAKRLAAQQIERLPAILRDGDGVPRAPQRDCEREKHVGVVVNQKNLSHCHHSGRRRNLRIRPCH